MAEPHFPRYRGRLLRRVAVIGAGTMGRGIAQACAVAGCDVALVDANPSRGTEALREIGDTLERLGARGEISAADVAAALARFTAYEHLRDAVAGADLIIEAVPEDVTLKERVFREVDACCDAEALLATNTSSLSPTRLSGVLRAPERLVGMHFFNPVHRMHLVEVVRGDATTAEAVNAATAFTRFLGKEPIVVRDTPGFATSRLGVVLGLEAIRMLEQGVATAEEIDRAMELGYNHPMGPLRLGDLVGLDVRLRIADHLHAELRGGQYRAPELLRRLVAEGKLGKKTGEGFYRWDR